MYELILYAGLGILFFGAIGIIMTAFRTSLLWGLGVFMPPITLIYVFSHWQEAKGPFKTLTLGALIITVFAYMNGGMAAVTAMGSHISSPAVIESQSLPASQPSTPVSPPAVDRMNQPSVTFAQPTPVQSLPKAARPKVQTGSYRCDGRQHCSQMTSCAEATYFLRNCPNTKMDGNGDGIPCEKQWCKG